ncbi:MAG: RNA-binding protein [Methanomassiliicoccaceae archaeon]|jgi:translin|nr:RNA-binding protein [Methanomassiliicoccaceae archaeon]
MREIPGIVASVSERMDHLETIRERSIAASRSIIRMTKKAIHAIHSHDDHTGILNDAVSGFGLLYEMIKNEPEVLLSGPVADAMMELAEACILSSIVLGEDVPSCSSLNVTPQAWALGLADCLGELRRILLDHLMNERMREAREVFDKMEIVCDAVLSLDVPDAILPIRRKQDVARSVMERTRTDITNALLMSNANLKY